LVCRIVSIPRAHLPVPALKPLAVSSWMCWPADPPKEWKGCFGRNLATSNSLLKF